MMLIAAGAISLWVNACIDGTLHGEPKTLCHEFQIRSYPTVEACEKTHEQSVSEWLNGMLRINIPLHLLGARCGPAEQEGDDI